MLTDSAYSQHGATDGRTQAQLVGSEEEWSEVRAGSIEARWKRDAPAQERNAEERERPEGEEPQAGDRDRALRSAREGREGSPEGWREEVLAQEIRRPQEDRRPQEIRGPEEERPEVLVQLTDDGRTQQAGRR